MSHQDNPTRTVIYSECCVRDDGLELIGNTRSGVKRSHAQNLGTKQIGPQSGRQEPAFNQGTESELACEGGYKRKPTFCSGTILMRGDRKHSM